MGLQTWKKSPDGKILKSDVSIAKNYLSEKEIKQLERVVSMYLDYAENQAARNIPMKMVDWIEKLDAFLQFNEYDLLQNAGKISSAVAKQLAHHKAQEIRVKLGGSASIFSFKPKGMHWKTYTRLKGKVMKSEMAFYNNVSSRLDHIALRMKGRKG